MAPVRDVAVIAGSLRKESFSRKLAHSMSELAPPSLKLELVEIGDLAAYNPDLDDTPPKPWTELRERIRASDAVLFITPEYNRSVPGLLKNVIDIGSRPYGKSAWNRKPCAVISNSPGALSGFGANHHLRQCLVFLDMPVLQQPEAYIGGIDKKFDPSGRMTDESTRGFLTKLLTAFDDWIARTGAR
jgi:chromate reductase, NAD(P)H dehydrogenase (quinone)